jgi:uncharacterized protein (DUF1684 family)
MVEIRQRSTLFAGILLSTAILTACETPAPAPDPDYVAGVEQWQTERDERLKSEDGWLTLVGLHWLEEGDNRFGTAPDNDIVLPEGSAPDYVGSLTLDGEEITVVAAEGSDLTLDGGPLTRPEIRADDPGPADVLRTGDLSLYVIRRNDRHAVRVKNPRSDVRAEFSGMEYFPIDPTWRIDAVFVPYDEPKPIQVPNVLGYVETMQAPGHVEFEVNGESLKLVPVSSNGSTKLFFIFGDETNGKETYGAGRFLYTPLPENGKVDLDFNKAYSPPCVFTPYATCPTPPKENRLPARIEAGEKNYAAH